jgi:hypothetical protein
MSAYDWDTATSPNLDNRSWDPGDVIMYGLGSFSIDVNLLRSMQSTVQSGPVLMHSGREVWKKVLSSRVVILLTARYAGSVSLVRAPVATACPIKVLYVG